MKVLKFIEGVLIRAVLIFTALILLVGFTWLIYELTIFFWHTTYWFVAIFLAFILLSNFLAKLVSAYLDVHYEGKTS